MGRNLISVGDLERTVFTGALSDRVIKMFNALRAFKATRNNGIYIMLAEVMGDLDFTITNIDDTKKRHNRLAHVSGKGLKFLNDTGVFGKDQVSNMLFYDYCVLDKHYRISFAYITYKTPRVSEYIHTNL